MSDVIISNVITTLIVFLGFIGNALYLRGSFSARLKNAEDDIEDLKDNVRYKDTCESMASGFETRISSLETVRNGKLGV